MQASRKHITRDKSYLRRTAEQEVGEGPCCANGGVRSVCAVLLGSPHQQAAQGKSSAVRKQNLACLPPFASNIPCTVCECTSQLDTNGANALGRTSAQMAIVLRLMWTQGRPVHLIDNCLCSSRSLTFTSLHTSQDGKESSGRAAVSPRAQAHCSATSSPCAQSRWRISAGAAARTAAAGSEPAHAKLVQIQAASSTASRARRI